MSETAGEHDTAEERQLRAQFARMRGDDLRLRALGRGAPDFGPMIERARPAEVGAVAAAAAVAGVLMTDRTTSDIEFERLVVGYSTDVATRIWDSPTAALLAVPGARLLREVPALGPSALPTLPLDVVETES